MKNKKSLICLSAIMIFIFHLWVPLFNGNIFLSNIEKYLRYICYIGVDIFFFISAYSLAKRDINYKDFIKNRFINIYLKFIVFSFIAFIYKKYSLGRFISIITGIEFFKKGGGSFLWFIPAIMILYLLIPFYKKLDKKYKMTPIILFIMWLLFSVFISSFTTYNKIFIFTNRIPIFMIGYYISKLNIISKLSNNKYNITMILCLILGTFISYITYINHLKFNYLYDVYYLLNIPLIIGIILLVDKIPQNIIIDKLSNISLELYAMQMIFGFKLASNLLFKINFNLIINILLLLILIIISYIFNLIYGEIKNKISMRFCRTNMKV